MYNIVRYVKEKLNNLQTSIRNIIENINYRGNDNFSRNIDNFNLRKYSIYVLVITGIFIIVFIGFNGSNDDEFKTFEQLLSNKTLTYIKNNNITLDDGKSKLLSFGEINFIPANNLNCEKNGSVLVTKENNNYQYQYYYSCGEHVSNPIQTVSDNNDEAVDYIAIRGNNPTYISINETYEDPGYVLIDPDADVDTYNNIVQAEGVYHVNYVVKSNESEYTVKRIVIVTNKNLNNNPSNNTNPPTIKLVGGNEVNILLGTNYEESGYKATDSDNNDLSDKVIVNNTVDSNNIGTYEINYIVTDGNNLTKTITRKVNVIDIQLNSNSNLYTNKTIDINVSVTNDNYYYTTLPNYSNYFTTNFTYKVNNNGTYTFTVYSKTGNPVSKNITIGNVDIDSPFGTCYMNENGLITTNIKDSKSSIVGYSYFLNGNYTDYIASSSYKTTFTYNTVSTRVKDGAGNIKYITCSKADRPASLDPIVPEKFSHSIISDTLKSWIIRKKNYTMIRVWAKEPYKQLHKYSATDYGKSNDNFDNVAKKALENKIDKNDVAIGWNHTVSVWYGGRSSDEFSKYDRAGLVIKEGQVLRNDYSTTGVERSPLAAIDNKNTLNFYNDYKLDPQKRQIMYQNAINSGTLNTINISQLAVKDGVAVLKKKKGHYPAVYQGFCQIDRNNFLYVITDGGWWPFPMAELLRDLGCIDGYRLDGGGSTNLWLKDKNDKNWNQIKGDGSRDAWSIFYWTEL